ncbi:MAG: putative quinol monooxygenase [Bryobacteraceae bacterium]
MSLIVVALLPARPDKIEDTRALLLGLIAPTRAEAGCISYQLHQNNANPADFCFIEEWKDDDALDQHLATPHLQAARERMPELLAGPPDIRRYSLIG